MKKILVHAAIAASLVMHGNAQADSWSVQLDNAAQNGVFDIYFLADSANAHDVVVENYQLDFQFDTTELRYLGFSNTPPADLTANFMGRMREVAPGVLRNFNSALGFDEGILGYRAAPGSSYRLGTVRFEILDPTLAQDGQVDFWLDTTSVFAGVSIDHDDNPDTIAQFYYFKNDPSLATYGAGMDVGAAAAPVPVPGAIWLVGAGLIGLAGVRRRRAA